MKSSLTESPGNGNFFRQRVPLYSWAAPQAIVIPTQYSDGEKKLVLASYESESSLTHLSAPDRAWVVANSIVWSVAEPMWQE